MVTPTQGGWLPQHRVLLLVAATFYTEAGPYFPEKSVTFAHDVAIPVWNFNHNIASSIRNGLTA
jgi:hypothetical protein